MAKKEQIQVSSIYSLRNDLTLRQYEVRIYDIFSSGNFVSLKEGQLNDARTQLEDKSIELSEVKLQVQMLKEKVLFEA